MRRMWTCLFLLVSPMMVLADIPSAPDTDLSLKYLGQIFGNVPGALQGNGTSLMSGLFGVFNEGVFAVAAIWLIYTIFQVMMNTATADGPQKSLKNMFLWLRVIVGFSLLIPLPSGYCLAQELLMQVVVQSVNLADETWDYALDYMQDGGLIFHNPKDSGPVKSLSDLDSFIGVNGSDPSAGSFAYKLFSSEVCMYMSNNYNKLNAAHDNVAKQGSLKPYNAIGLQPVVDPSNALKANTGAIYFPGYGDVMSIPTTKADGSIDQAPHNCGVIAMPTTISKNSTITQYNQAYAAMNQAVLDMQPLAKRVAEQVLPASGGSPSGAVASTFGASVLKQVVVDYMSLIQPVADFGNESAKKTNAAGEFAAQAKQEGWFNAGGFYWDMVRWNDSMQSNQGDPTKLVPAAKTVINQNSPFKDDLNQDIANAQNQLSAGMWTDARTALGKWLGSSKQETFNHRGISGNVVMGVDLGVIEIPLKKMVDKISASMNTMNAYNPMRESFIVGKYALNAAGWIWAALIMILTPISIAAGVCDSANPGNVIFKGITTWLTPLALASAGFLFTTGVVLTFYAPIYPFLLFLFGVIGWVLYVIEAMVAAPLVAFGMSHPEGHDFMGRAEQALMLVLGVFLRPTLMVLGYLVGIMLVYVASGFLNLILGQVFMSTYRSEYDPGVGDAMDGAWSILGGSPSGNATHFTGNSISDTLLLPVILALYSSIMLETVNQCFSAIHQLPDMVLRWIGGPVQQSDSAQRAQSVKSEVASAGQQASQMGGKVPEAASGGMAGVTVGGGKGLQKMLGSKGGSGDDSKGGETKGETKGGGDANDAPGGPAGDIPPEAALLA